MKNPVIFRVGRSRSPQIGCLLTFFVFATIGCCISLFLVCCTSSNKEKKMDTTKITHDTIVSIWEEKEFVDEFNSPTGEIFLQTMIEGKFSNSASTNEDLKVILSIDKDSTLYFKFAEFNNHLVKGEFLFGKIRGKKYPSGEYLDGIIGLNFDSNGVATLRPHDVGWRYMVSPLGYEDDKTLKFYFSDEREGDVPSTYTFQIDDISILKDAFEKLNKLY